MHSAQLLWEDCGFPRWSVVFTLPNAIFFYYLFNDFYKKAYEGSGDKSKSNGAVSNGTTRNGEITNNETHDIKQNGEVHKRNGIKNESQINDLRNGDVNSNKMFDELSEKKIS